MDSFVEADDLTGFSSLACRNRWLVLQSLREAAGVDCLLLVLGPDANFSRGSEVAFNWLVTGLCGRELLSAPLNREYEECVVCLSATRSALFCKPAVHEQLAMRTAMWESFEVVVPIPKEDSNVDLYDACKVGFLIHVVSGCCSIGIAMDRADAKPDVKMALERWPLVHAFGYDEYGQGFMTLKRSVVNFGLLLQQVVYSQWDMHAVSWAQGHVEKLRRAWQEALLVQDRNSPVREKPSQMMMTAPLVDYFEYGRLSLTDNDIRELGGEDGPQGAGLALLDPAPRILIGSVQTAEVLHGVTLGCITSPQLAPREAAQHMIWEAVDPITGMAATRTYALRSIAGSPGLGGRQLQVLLHAYTAAAACCQHLLKEKLADGTGLTAGSMELKKAALAFIRSSYPGLSGTPDVFCAQIDAMGMVSASAPQPGSAVLLFVRVTVTGVLCPETGNALGAVAYGESAFHVVSMTPDASPTSASHTLTEAVPSFAFWIAPDECERSQSVKAGLDSVQGIGAPTVPYVALGHRPGVRVPLEPPRPPPDPLGLGSLIEAAVHCTLVADFGACLGRSGLVAGRAEGTAWTFSSGKIVVHSPRTGYMVLHVRCSGHGFPAAEAHDGLVWVPAEMPGQGPSARLAVTVSPTTALQWQNQAMSAAQNSGQVANVPDLQWVDVARDRKAGKLSGFHEFVAMVALSTVLAGRSPDEEAGAVFASKAMTLGASAPLRKCIWVSGLPGCGALDVALLLAKALNGLLVDLGAVVGASPQPAADDITQVATSLAAAIQASVAAHDVVVVSDVRATPHEVLVGLAASRPFADMCYIRHVIAVLEPLIAYPWDFSRHPLMLSRVHRGWTSSVVVEDYGLTAGGPAAHEWHVLKARLLKELCCCRGRASVLVKPLMGALLESVMQEPRASAARLAVALPRAPAPLQESTPNSQGVCQPPGKLQSVFVPIDRPLDIGALRACCARLLAAASEAACPAAGVPPEAAWRGLFCVEARVVGAMGGELWHSQPEELWAAVSSGGWPGVHQLVLTPKGALRPPTAWAYPLSNALGVMLWWYWRPGDSPSELHRAAEAAIARCRLRPPAPQPLWSPADVPAEELARLGAEVQGGALPDGYFSMSADYVDVNGHRTRQHPLLKARLCELVASHNAVVEARNAMLSRIASLPAFGDS